MSTTNVNRAQATIQVLRADPALYQAYLDQRPEAMSPQREKKAYVSELGPRLRAMGLGGAPNVESRVEFE